MSLDFCHGWPNKAIFGHMVAIIVVLKANPNSILRLLLTPSLTLGTPAGLRIMTFYLTVVL